MKRKDKYLILFFITFNLSLTVVVADSNPLKEYVSDEVFYSGEKKFSGGNDIFRTKIYSKVDIEKEIAAAKAIIKSIFLRVSFIMERNNKYTATFYYKNEDGRVTRKVITNRNLLKIGKNKYSIVVEKDGIIIIDAKSKVKVKLEKKGR